MIFLLLQTMEIYLKQIYLWKRYINTFFLQSFWSKLDGLIAIIRFFSEEANYFSRVKKEKILLKNSASLDTNK